MMKSFKVFLKENLGPIKSNKLDITDPLTHFYYGAVSAEHRGKVQDPTQYDPALAIRTKARPKTAKQMSTAYGQAQITKSTMQDALNRHKELFDPETSEYAKKFIAQGTKFAQAQKGDKKYDYGGSGDLSGEEYNLPYQKAAIAVMKGKLKDAKIDPSKNLDDDQLTTGIQRWRGVPEDQDPAYYAAFRKGFKKYQEQGKQETFNQEASANQQASSEGMDIGDDYIKTKGYAQSPVDWSEKYPENYDDTKKGLAR